MKRLNKTRGVLLFAFNNEQINYVDLAVYCGERIKQHWGLPVTVVTDSPFSHEHIECVTTTSPEVYSSRFFKGYAGVQKFLNGNRAEAFQFSPYQETIVLDSDFLVSTTQVLDVWNGKGVQLCNSANLLSGRPLTHDMASLGPTGLRMFWATVLCFDRSKESQLFFAYWQKVKRWYKAYSNIYGFSDTLMRNDFCVTVAVDLLAQKVGSSEPFVLPYSIPTAGFDMDVTGLSPLTAKVDGTELMFPTTDVHILNKKPLLDLIAQEF